MWCVCVWVYVHVSVMCASGCVCVVCGWAAGGVGCRICVRPTVISAPSKIGHSSLNLLWIFSFGLYGHYYRQSCVPAILLRDLIGSFIVSFSPFPGQIKKAEASSKKGKQSPQAERWACDWLFVSQTLRQSIRGGRSKGMRLAFSWALYCKLHLLCQLV